MCSLAEKISSSTRLLYYLICFAQLYPQNCSFYFPCQLACRSENSVPMVNDRLSGSLWGCHWAITAKKLNKVPHGKIITLVFNTAKARSPE